MNRRPAGRGGLHPKKIALLHVARKQLGLDEDSYRDILRRWAGVETSTDLDPVGFELVMIRLEQLGFKSTWMKRTFGDRAGMATPGQVDLIRRLWDGYDPEAGEPGLNAWLHRFHHVSALRFVDAGKATKVIAALKAMVARRRN